MPAEKCPLFPSSKRLRSGAFYYLRTAVQRSFRAPPWNFTQSRSPSSNICRNFVCVCFQKVQLRQMHTNKLKWFGCLPLKKRRNKNSCTPKLWICCKRRATELDGKQCTWSMWANAGDCTWGVNADSLCNAVYPKCMRCLLKMVQRRFSLVKWN